MEDPLKKALPNPRSIATMDFGQAYDLQQSRSVNNGKDFFNGETRWRTT